MSTALAKPLVDLAAAINREHGEFESAMKKGLPHAMEAGRLLTEAKAQVEHGGWIKWVEEHCDFTRQTAATYMRVFERRDELADGANGTRVFHLPLREAVKQLAEPKDPPATVDHGRGLGGAIIWNLGDDDENLIPPPGHALIGVRESGVETGLIVISPYEEDGYFYVSHAFTDGQDHGYIESLGGRPIREDYIQNVLRVFDVPPLETWEWDAVPWDEDIRAAVPWAR